MMSELIGKRAKKAVLVSILTKIQAGKKLTAADIRFIKEMEEEERAELSKRVPQTTIEPDPTPAGLNEDLEEWTLRDGIVGGKKVKLQELALRHETEMKALERRLCRVQRSLLARYGFEGYKKTGRLSGNEALALQWVRTIGQLARISREWELQMDGFIAAREEGRPTSLEEFAILMNTLKQLTEKRDGLSLKIRELSLKEMKAGASAQSRSNVFEIHLGNEDLMEE